MKQALITAALLYTAYGCSALGLDPTAEYTYVDPTTGQEVTTTVGDAIADQIDSAGGTASNLVGKAVGVATGNPVVGVSASALLAALIGTGTSRLRKKGVPTSGGGEAAPDPDNQE